jgi:tellurite resistance protein
MVSPSEEEEKYFHQREFERREQVRRDIHAAALKVAESRRMAETLGQPGEAVLHRIQALGFDADTARIFDLIPLVHVAWADGSVSAKERTAVFRVLEARGIPEQSEAWQLMAALLEKRPNEPFLEETLKLLSEIASTAGTKAHTIVDLCVAVAEAQSSLFGLGAKVNTDERKLIEHISSLLGQSASEATHQKLTGSGETTARPRF